LNAWIWSTGWLFEKGFRDYAGSGVIFMIGGTAAFWGASVCGDRIGIEEYR
jgi:Amt family ammonium transporter